MADPSFPGSNQGQSYPLADKTKQPIPPDDLLAPGYSPQPTHDYPPAAGRPYLAQPHVAYPAATGYPPQPVADQPGYPQHSLMPLLQQATHHQNTDIYNNRWDILAIITPTQLLL